MTFILPSLAECRLFKTDLIGRLFGVAPLAVAQPLSSQIPLESGILGVGVGAKVSGGFISENLSLRVYVRAKKPLRDIPIGEIVPSEVNGLITDVISVGDIVAHAPCGTSIGHKDISAGTMGCLVSLENQAGVYILSNNHVLANTNAAAVNDEIFQPGPADGGKAPPLALLEDFEPISFDGPNTMDAAIARVLDSTQVSPDILKIGLSNSPSRMGQVYQSVRKHGRTTLHTVGVIVGIAEDVRVRYGNQTAAFEDQLAVAGVGGVFSQGGDSGSLVVDALSMAPVGLLFAGGGQQTFANPIQPVLDRFRARILP